MDVDRRLDLADLVKRKSCFLFGPRQTGKSFAIRKRLADYRCYNLLKTDVFLKLSREPQRLRQEIGEDEEIVVIDEIQKLPMLLDEVQILIEENGIRFLLTGSSARKLRRTGVNLLGGRATEKRIHPFVCGELRDRFDLLRALDVGTIPSIYLSDEPFEDLEAYVGTYLKEEVAAEAIVRNVPAFSRFLTVAALCNGQILNYSNIAGDAEVPRSTVQEYFQILRDTLLGDDLPAWGETTRRKPITTSKFFLFDIGVARHLQNRTGLRQGSPEFGEAFEGYLHHELRTYCDYEGKRALHYWRSSSGFEVDFILNNQTAIEAKAKRTISDRDLRGLKALRQENLLTHHILVCLDDTPREKDGVAILPWDLFLERLWGGEYG